MNEQQLNKIEEAIWQALEFLQSHSPEDRPEARFDGVLNDLRSAHTLIRAWRGLVRSSTRDQTQDVLPGQMAIPGVNFGNTKK